LFIVNAGLSDPAFSSIVTDRSNDDDTDRPGLTLFHNSINIKTMHSPYWTKESPMKNKIRSLFLFYFLTFIWAMFCIATLGPLTVAEGQPAEESTTTEVPDVVGMSQADAQSEIMEAGLVVGTVTQAGSAEVDAGDIMGQNPTDGTSVAPGTAVNLVISIGPITSKVPNVVGMSQQDAQAAITSAGLTAGVSFTSSKTISSGIVIDQNPN